MLRLLLVRHGETEENRAGIRQGQGRGTLSPEGLQQVARLAERLRVESIDRILSSDLERARRTTEAIARHHACPVQYLPLLRERALGIFEGRTGADYQAAWQADGRDRNRFRPEGGESVTDLFERGRIALTHLLDAPPASTVLVSTHNGMIRALICLLDLRSPDDFWSLGQAHTSVSELLLDGDRRVRSAILNDTGHLQAMAS